MTPQRVEECLGRLQVEVRDVGITTTAKIKRLMTGLRVGPYDGVHRALAGGDINDPVLPGPQVAGAIGTAIVLYAQRRNACAKRRG